MSSTNAATPSHPYLYQTLMECERISYQVGECPLSIFTQLCPDFDQEIDEWRGIAGHDLVGLREIETEDLGQADQGVLGIAELWCGARL